MFSLALKNILYYRGRSFTTFILTFLSTLFFIVYVSMMDGSHKSMLENSLKVYTGAIEVYKKGYRDEGGSEYYLEDVHAKIQKIQNIEGVEAVSARYETYGLLSSKEYSAASMIGVIDPEKEKKLSSLEIARKEGAYLHAKSGNCLYMGDVLAQKLHVGIGEELAFVGAASDDSFAADILKVCGTFKSGSHEFDGGSAFIAKEYFDAILYSHDKASYITIRLNDINKIDTVHAKIVQVLADESLEVLTWRTLMKSMVEAMEVDSLFGYISLGLFLVVIFFVVMIYGFTNISSRIREFGVLRCIGLHRRDMLSLLLWEITLLSFFAILVATPIGAYICYYYSVNPIIIEGMAEMYKDYGIVSDEMPLDFNLFTILWNIAVIFVLNILSIIYPYYYVSSFTPIQASKHV
jgi:ABC-type lipoprotein release transport system permease subunit